MFKTGISLLYVSEYSKAQFEKSFNVLKKYNDLKILNLSLANDVALKNISENLPIGTIICKVLDTVDIIEICFPVMSTHISMPVKTNELIWFFQDETPFSSTSVEDGHPLLAIKSYWLSRKIGGKISEDLNYTHFQRDSLITDLQTKDSEKYNQVSNDALESNKLKTYKKEIEKIVKIPGFENELIYVNLYNSGMLENAETMIQKEKNINIFPDAVPRWFSKPYELTFQGSNNTLINLTTTNNTDEDFSSKGAIDIVSGRFFLDKYISEEESNLHIFENKIIKNKEEDREKTFIFKKNSFATIENTLGNLETLKSQNHYLNTEEINELSEGKISLFKDASRIYISEADNIDNSLYYDTTWISDQDLILSDIDKIFLSNESLEFQKGYLPNNNITLNNLTSVPLDENNFTVPSIFMKTNNIRLISRKQIENEESELFLNEGSIRLVKESDNFLNYSHICLEDDGQILIDGNTILLGNFKKEVVRQNIDSIENIQELSDTNEDYIGMHGNGNGLLIGYNENLAESLVLGNTLESMLKELIHINLDLLEEINKISNNLLNHTHSGVTPGAAISQPPNLPITKPLVLDTENFVTSEKPVIDSRYQNLSDNLRHMLSRFAKTT